MESNKSYIYETDILGGPNIDAIDLKWSSKELKLFAIYIYELVSNYFNI